MAVNESAYRFGAFHLTPAQRELWCSGRLLPVQPKVPDTLTYLIQHRDRAVGRDELISAVLIGSKAWRAALAQSRRLAGERVIPAMLVEPPAPAGAADTRIAAAQ